MARPTRDRDPHPGDLRILKEIAEALNGATEVDQALTTTLERVADLLGLHTGWIWLTDPRTGRFYSAVAQRLPPFLQEPVRMSGHTCWCLQAFRDGRLTAGNIDVMECSRLHGAAGLAATRGLRYHASIPLYFGDRPLGIMNVAAPAWRKLTQRELDLLSTIASQVGVAIERGRLAGEGVRIARMEERAHLARQIHDTLVQRLTAIGLHIEAALDALPREGDASMPETTPRPSIASSKRAHDATEVFRAPLLRGSGRVAQARDGQAAPVTASATRTASEQSVFELERALALSRAGLEDARDSMRALREPAAARTGGGRGVGAGVGLPEASGQLLSGRSSSGQTPTGQTLSESLGALARAFTAETGIRVRVRATAEVTVASADEEELYRIASEALTNVRRHARATDIEISLRSGRGRARLEIADNGAGFNPRARTAGFGLVGMRERAQALGGALRVTTQPGRGTRVILTMPHRLATPVTATTPKTAKTAGVNATTATPAADAAARLAKTAKIAARPTPSHRPRRRGASARSRR